ncbi:MAG: ABC transporter ATP-binding protein [Bacillus sp. (in: firmicutes)]
MEVTLRLQNVTKKIKKKTIIDGLSFDVHKGEIFGFLGPNGAGKTTTIRMIVGLMKMTEGDIFICGDSVRTDFEKAIGHIGAIVENPELYKYLTGYQNLVHFARMSKGVSKARIDEVIELVGLSERIHEKVKGYSLGMRQRLGLAQALLHRPKVLILDEPTNGLDPQGIREIRNYMKRLSKEEGMTVIVSSHLLSEMEMMCDRFGIIQNGKLVDIQDVNGDQEDKKIIRLNVDPLSEARDLLADRYPAGKLSVLDGHIHLEAAKSEIPGVIKVLVENGIAIYGVEHVTLSLEEKFLQITGTGGQIK